MSSPKYLAGVNAKIKRADEHIERLKTLVDAFKASEPYAPFLDRDPNTGHCDLYLVRKQRPSEDISLAIGDVVHNLRSALDHFAYQWVLRRGSGAPDPRTQFPIFAFRRARLRGTRTIRGYEERVTEQLPGISRCTAAGAVFEGVQPYHRAYRPLWHVNHLDVLDKHRLLQVTSSRIANTGLGINTMFGFAMHSLNLYGAASMQTRAKIGDFTLVQSNPGAQLQMNPKATVYVVFGKGKAVSSSVAGKDVMATIETARDVIVTDVLPKLRQLL